MKKKDDKKQSAPHVITYRDAKESAGSLCRETGKRRTRSVTPFRTNPSVIKETTLLERAIEKCGTRVRDNPSYRMSQTLLG